MSDTGFPVVFFALFSLLWLLVLLSYAVGIAALISVARTADAAFGPWWDNTKQIWVIGLVVAFLIPAGALVTGVAWFVAGKGPLRRGGRLVGRPFWSGPAKPAPYGYGPPGPGPGQPPMPGQPPWLGPPPPPGGVGPG